MTTATLEMKKDKEEKTSLMQTAWLSSLIGNLLEHYDTALYGFLAPFIAPLFFGSKNPTMALIMAYALLPLSTLSKPFGALFFGYIGDTYGRNTALRASIFGMAFVTALIGFLPVESQVGILAPICLGVCRVLQGFFSSGESVGGAIYLLERSPDSSHNYLSSLYGGSITAGILLASFVVTLSNSFQFSWRYLFWLGSLTAIVGFFFRSRNRNRVKEKEPVILSESFIYRFKKTLKMQLSVIWQQRKALGAIMIASGFSYSSYAIALVLINSFVPLVSNYTLDEMMHLNTYLIALDLVLLPFIGILIASYKHEKVMMTACLLTVFVCLPLVYMLPFASYPMIIIIRTIFVVVGVLFCAPYYAWSLKLVPEKHRYTLLSLGYALGSQGIGSPTASLSLSLFHATGATLAVAWYWILLALLTFGYLVWMRGNNLSILEKKSLSYNSNSS